jgi:hypothetical protein
MGGKITKAFKYPSLQFEKCAALYFAMFPIYFCQRGVKQSKQTTIARLVKHYHISRLVSVNVFCLTLMCD